MQAGDHAAARTWFRRVLNAGVSDHHARLILMTLALLEEGETGEFEAGQEAP